MNKIPERNGVKPFSCFAVRVVPLQLQFKDAIDLKSKALHILSKTDRLWSALLPYARFWGEHTLGEDLLGENTDKIRRYQPKFHKTIH
jgi:hypothetical protein